MQLLVNAQMLSEKLQKITSSQSSWKDYMATQKKGGIYSFFANYN